MTEILDILTTAHSPLDGFDMRPWSSVERSTRPVNDDGLALHRSSKGAAIRRKVLLRTTRI